MFNQLSRPSVSEEVLEQIKDFITSGKVNVGEQLPTETQLSSMLGVSRNTVREAFITLQAQGYIEIKRGKGVFVIDPTDFYERTFLEWFQKNEFQIHQLLEARMTLEPYTAFIAAQKITENEIKEIEEIHEEYIGAVNSGKIDDIVILDESFHLKIFKVSRNEILELFYTSIVPALKDYRKNVFSPTTNPQTSVEAHSNIINALKERNSQKAFGAMRDHIEEAKLNVTGVAQKIASSPKNRSDN
ncbi:hypothetical protein CVD28_19025 [Bacillus sp. M6-12]|uniref:FadR/GntR family transcriptional regulator n=1 Tax=Bacillus sp. M6-12 TaxID=2054166 RepID=UPI000C761DD9|nr:FadR/GntR family transcriptional regulator [Bacillus sp. M6-12]PLS16134.1 hypothetical protein CVD28_19025 [Bacillus sp. M6-12]